MHRRLYRPPDFFARSIQFGDPQVVFDAVVEQVGSWVTKLSISRRLAVLIWSMGVSEISHPLPHIPEPH